MSFQDLKTALQTPVGDISVATLIYYYYNYKRNNINNSLFVFLTLLP